MSGDGPTPDTDTDQTDSDREHLLATGRDIAYQRREWAAQRIGWVAMAVLVGAALLGALGSGGPLALGEATASDGSLRITYLRVDRHHAPSRFAVEVAPGLTGSGEVRLWLDRAFVEQLEIESVVPEPESVEVEPDRLIYTFAVSDAAGPLEITFAYRHDGFWRQKGQIGLVDGTSVTMRQFVLP